MTEDHDNPDQFSNSQEFRYKTVYITAKQPVHDLLAT